jgi:uncharacterized membrane protein YeaQ/YmgE (transglycosylase-associated protein family)
MENLLWIAAGSLLGWLSYSFLRFNSERGLLISMALGAAGALIGAHAIAPLFVTEAVPVGEVSLPLVLVASGAAAGLLALGDLLHQRFGV